MKRINRELEERDRAKYYLEVPDAGFSPEKNKWTIENSIKKFEAMRKKKWNERVEEYRERSDATASFLRAVDRGGSNDLGRYFGKKMIAHLRGDSILADIRLLMANAEKKQKQF